MVGFSVAQRDIRDYYNGDVQWIMIVTLIAVFLIRRCCCARWWPPIYLVASVILSYVSAVGIGVVFFQFVLATAFVERAWHGVSGSRRGGRGLQPAADLADP